MMIIVHVRVLLAMLMVMLLAGIVVGIYFATQGVS